MKTYWVYIVPSRSRTPYTGVIGDLARRLHQHRTRAVPGFTRRYFADRLVYVEATSDVNAGIAREKQIKRWTRAKKVALIEAQNPEWRDLGGEWVESKEWKSLYRDEGDPSTAGALRAPSARDDTRDSSTPVAPRTCARDDSRPASGALRSE